MEAQSALSEWISYRDALVSLVRREISTRYRQTILGLGWAILQPVLQVFVLTSVFTQLFQWGGVAHFAWSSAVAVLPWIYFTKAVSGGAHSLHNSVGVWTKVYLPKEWFPISVCLSHLSDFFVGTLVLVLLAMVTDLQQGPMEPLRFLLWPFLVTELLVLSIALSLFLSVMQVKFRDVGFAISYFLQAGFFVSPVFYSMDRLGSVSPLWYLNPLVGILEGFRWVFSAGIPFPGQALLVSVVLTTTLMIFGGMYFRLTSRRLADYAG